MSVAPIGGGIPSLPQLSPTSASDAATDATSGSGFGNALTSSLESLSSTTDKADQLAQGVATGSGNLGEYMVAANEANLQTGLTVAVRDKAVAAFNQIMEMQF